ncbi:MAG: hypothetical protein E7456_07645 [Ruminococcaceae bacterium]|nr:hypothetical protein [Oscillospiraceae bacterium]
MVKVIMDHQGSGKTKNIVQLVNEAVKDARGDIVCIERKAELTYDVSHRVRLVQASRIGGFGSVDFFKGFICGIVEGNHDITQIFIDGLTKFVDGFTIRELESFLDWCEALGERERIKFTISISQNADLATPEIKKYF